MHTDMEMSVLRIPSGDFVPDFKDAKCMQKQILEL
jgi:hypothetical protein